MNPSKKSQLVARFVGTKNHRNLDEDDLKNLRISSAEKLCIWLEAKENTDLADWNISIDSVEKVAVVIGIHASQASKITGSLTINHTQPNTTSHTTILVATDDTSRVHLTGRICVDDTAVESLSDLTMQGLLLGKSSSITLRPKLDIYQGDIACSHGATVSGISVQTTEYLASRGIDLETVKRLATWAFFAHHKLNVTEYNV